MTLRDGTFEPVVVPKRQKDVSEIEDKVLAMYARGMSQRDISSTIEDIYGFKVSHEMISDITDSILDELNECIDISIENMPKHLYLSIAFM